MPSYGSALAGGGRERLLGTNALPDGGLSVAGTEGAGTLQTIKELRTKIIDRAAADPEFRALLVGDPKRAIGRELSIPIPASYSIEVHVEDHTTAHLVLPPDSRLSNSELERIGIGGFGGHRSDFQLGRAKGFLEALEEWVRSW